MIDFVSLVLRELEYARQKYPEPFRTASDAAHIIYEEYSEFLAASQGSSRRQGVAMLAQLVSVAAMCQRAAEDLNIVQPYDIPFTES